MRDRGDSEDAIVEAFPEICYSRWVTTERSMVRRAAFTRIAAGLDTAMVRVVAAPAGCQSVAAVMRACARGRGSRSRPRILQDPTHPPRAREGSIFVVIRTAHPCRAGLGWGRGLRVRDAGARR